MFQQILADWWYPAMALKLPTIHLCIAKQIINNSDEVFLVNYYANAYNFNTGGMQGKLQELANEAANIHLSSNVVILFNVNQASSDPNIFGYCEDNEFGEAFDNFMIGYDAASIANKDMLNVIGYQFFKYSEAKIARPLLP